MYSIIGVSGIIIILMTFATGIYCRAMIKQTVTPSLSAWIIMTAATVFGLIAYYYTPDADVKRIPAHWVGAINCCVLLGVLYWTQYYSTKKKIEFSKFQWLCIGVSLALLIVWGVAKLSSFEMVELIAIFCIEKLVLLEVSENRFENVSIFCNLLMQIILLIGHCGVIYNLVVRDENVETYLSWGIVFFAFCLNFSLVETSIENIFMGRTVISLGVILLVMVWFDVKNGVFWKKE